MGEMKGVFFSEHLPGENSAGLIPSCLYCKEQCFDILKMSCSSELVCSCSTASAYMGF